MKSGLNVHQIHFSKGFKCIILQGFDGKCRKDPVRTCTLFPKHVTFTPRYGQLVLGNTSTENFGVISRTWRKVKDGRTNIRKERRILYTLGINAGILQDKDLLT